MSMADYVKVLAPELCLVAGACVIFLLGVGRAPLVRWLVRPLAVSAIIVALLATWFVGVPSSSRRCRSGSSTIFRNSYDGLRCRWGWSCFW